MGLIASILQVALDALDVTLTEVEITQGLYPGMWWLDTDTPFSVHVSYLHGIGLSVSVFAYLEECKMPNCHSC